ncbi:MAG: hypothetical protein JNM81_08505 [Rhodospirillaceae bacterium]|nr:hypothetical protein [Rhodospirillaceae bacterium]
MATTVMIATPCYGGLVTHGFTTSLLRLMPVAQKSGINLIVNLSGGDALITRARNNMVAEFLRSKASHLMFIDADISFDPEQFIKLVVANKDVTAALYPAKAYDWAELPGRVRSGEPLDKAGLHYVAEQCVGDQLKFDGDFVTAEYVGTGFLLIKRDVIERMIAAYPETKYKHVHGFSAAQNTSDLFYALFDCIIDPVSGHYLSEDYTFCKRWRKMGGEVWMDTKSKLSHTGPHTFVGDAAIRYTPRWAKP